MNYTELFKAHALYESNYGNKFYKLSIKSCHRGDIEEKTVSIVAFLVYFNKVWYTNSEEGKKAFNDLERHVSSIYELISSTKSTFDELENYSLTKVNLDDTFVNNSIKTLYRRFSEIFGATGASKALHLLLPRLIVMWDDTIRKNYEVTVADDENYLIFLMKVKGEILDFVREYANENNLDIDDAENAIIEKTGVYLTKLIDELNYLRYTRKELYLDTPDIEKPTKDEKKDKIEKIMEIINEIVQGAYEASKTDWVAKGNYSDMVTASADKLKRIVEGYAKKGDIEGILEYLFNVQRDDTGIRVSKILKACKKKTVEDVYDEIVRITRNC